MTLSELREQYPQYDSLSDGELAYRLWDKSYKGKIPMGVYADEIELDDDGFTGMIQSAHDSGYTPTSQTYAEGFVPGGSKTRAALQGMTFGFGDELVGNAAAGLEKLTGSEQSFSQLAQQYTGNERNQLDQFQKASPGTAIASELGGALVSPLNALRAPAILQRAGAGTRATFTAGAAGAAYGAGTGEGGIGERAQNAVEVGIPSAIFGGSLQQLLRVAPKLAQSFQNSSSRPTIESLRDTKNAAYAAVEASGLKFTPREMLNLYSKAHRAARAANYVEEVDRQTYAALKMIDAQRGKSPTIGELDKLRQGLWSRYTASNESEPAIREMIDHVDEIIENFPSTNDLMLAARTANSRYKKSELLDEAFKRAERQTAATGSGGNILNKYKQAVTSIMSNPNKAKWFNEAELAQMDQLVRGGFGENVMRRIGKLSPSGNGLMLALNIGAIAADPAMMVVTAGGALGKALSDSSGMRGANALQDAVATGRQAVQVPYLPGTGPAAASGAAQVNEYRQGQGPRR